MFCCRHACTHCQWCRRVYVRTLDDQKGSLIKLWFLNLKTFVLPDQKFKGKTLLALAFPSCLCCCSVGETGLHENKWLFWNRLGLSLLPLMSMRQQTLRGASKEHNPSFFLWAVSAEQSRKRWGVWFSANVNATVVWLANGFCLVARTWPKKEASAIFVWLGMMFSPHLLICMHTWLIC